MDAQVSTQKFQHADQLFRAGRFQEALQVLGELNQAHPNAKNVMYPAALCMEQLGRHDEALGICEQLIQQHQDPRAGELKNRLLQAKQGSGGVDADPLAAIGLSGGGGMGAGADILASPRRAPVEEPEERDWMQIGITVGCVVVIALVYLGAMPALLYRMQVAAGLEELATPMDSARLGLVALFVVAGLIGQVVGGFFGLLILEELPGDGFIENSLSLSNAFIRYNAAGVVPIAGWILGLYVLARSYELGCGGLLLTWVLSFMGWAIGYAMMYFLASVVAMAVV